MSILDKIDDFLSEEMSSFECDLILEEFSSSMKQIIPAKTLARLGKALAGFGNLDVQNSEFTEFKKDTLTPGKMKDRYIVCYFNDKNRFIRDSWAFIEYTDTDKITDITVDWYKFDRTYKYSKKSLIEYADNIWIVTKANGVSNYDVKKMRRDSQNGAVALTRNTTSPYVQDKSGYDLNKAQNALKDRLFAKTKDSMFEKIEKEFNVQFDKLISDLEAYKNAKNSKLEYADIKPLTSKFNVLITAAWVLKDCYKKPDEIPDYAVQNLKSYLGIKK